MSFVVKTYLVTKHKILPRSVNDRVMTTRLPLARKRHATIISAYSPTMINPDEVKGVFYSEWRGPSHVYQRMTNSSS